VWGDEDLDASRPDSGQNLPHVLDDIMCLKGRAAELVELAPLRDETSGV